MNNELSTFLAGRPMPRKLGDPLLRVKPFIFILNILVLIGVIGLIADAIQNKQGAILSLAGISIVSASFFLALLIIAFPKRRTNAIYLRSFGKDSESKVIREHIEVVLGPDYRLSGIRDPRRRVPHIIRPIALAYMALKYAGARYLNLEAGNDWKARIWSSFRDARVVFIDLRDVTDFVKEEIELSIQSVGLERIVFIISADQDVEDWKKNLVADYELSNSSKLNILAWDEKEKDKSPFMQELKQATEGLPDAPVELPASSFKLVDASIYTKGQLWKERLLNFVQFIIGMSILVGLVFFREIFGRVDTAFTIILITVGLGLNVYIIALFIKGILSRRARAKLASVFNLLYRQKLASELRKVYALVLMIFVGAGMYVYGIGIVYNDYTSRASLTDVMYGVLPRAKIHVTQYYFEHESWPASLEQTGFVLDPELSASVSDIAVDPESGAITVVLGSSFGPEMQNRAIANIPAPGFGGGIEWRCLTDLEPRFAPSNCEVTY